MYHYNTLGLILVDVLETMMRGADGELKKIEATAEFGELKEIKKLRTSQKQHKIISQVISKKEYMKTK